MCIEKTLKDNLVKYLMNCDRDVRRKFNGYLKRYPYIMFCPIKINNDEEHDCLHIGFTYRVLNKSELSESDVWIETDAHETNVFYLYTPYAEIVHNICDAVFISTDEFPKLYIKPAPLKVAINAPSVGEDVFGTIQYCVEEHLDREISIEMADMLAEAVSECTALESYLIYDKSYYNLNNIVEGEITVCIKYNSEVIGFVHCKGHDLYRKNISVVDLQKWNQVMDLIIDNSGVNDILVKQYRVINPKDDCDLYFPVQGVTDEDKR